MTRRFYYRLVVDFSHNICLLFRNTRYSEKKWGNVMIAKVITKRIFSKAKDIIKSARYDDFTIEEYFRKKGMDIGRGNRIQIRRFGGEPFLIRIGNHCTISSEVSFLTHDGGTWLFTDEMPSFQRFGPIEVLDNCFIGFRSTILPNVRIGPNSIVGACSVVTKDVPPSTIAAGNPAKIIGSIYEFKEKYMKIWGEQKPHGYFDGLKGGKSYSPKVIYEIKKRDMDLLRSHLTAIFFGKKTTKKSTKTSE